MKSVSWAEVKYAMAILAVAQIDTSWQEECLEEQEKIKAIARRDYIPSKYNEGFRERMK